jgi:ubiquinone/menaquinone biosynthesis C-methylase UbiE
VTDRTPYHIAELNIALDARDPRHLNPPSVPAGYAVLDIGCGAGQTLVALHPLGFACGIDVDADALLLGQRLARDLLFVRSTAEALPFRDGSFDVVIARFSLPYTDIRRALAEVKRVLSGRGYFWASMHPLSITWRSVKRAGFRGLPFFAYTIANSLWFQFTGRMFGFLGRYESFQTRSGMRRALATAGFTKINIARDKRFVIMASR